MVGDSPARGHVYATQLGGDPGRGSVLVFDRTSGQPKPAIDAFGDPEKYLGYGPLAVSPDGRWLLTGNYPTVEIPGYPATAFYLYDLDQRAPAPRGFNFPGDLEATGALWTAGGQAYLAAAWASWHQEGAKGPGGVFRFDPASGTVTAVAGDFAGYGQPVALSPDGAWLILETFTTDGSTTTYRTEAIPLAGGQRYTVAEGDTYALGWLQVP